MYSNIMIPLSLEDARETDRVIKAGQRLARPGARITFVHVLESIPIYVANVLSERAIRALRVCAETRLRDAVARIDSADGVLLDGRAGQRLTAWADDSAADCIVMAHHCHDCADDYPGSTTAWVVRHANCAVHLVR